MFKASGHEKQVLIVLLWSGLIFIGYNVLTAEAFTEAKECSSLSEPDDYLYCNDFDWSAFSPDRESVDEMCDASEDYAKNPKNCDKAYELVEEEEATEKELKKACDADDNAKWTETGCVVGEIEPTEEDIKERAKMTQSETFKKHVESKGIDYEDYDNLSAEKQEEIETEFKEDKSDEYAEELRSKEQSNPEVKPKLLVPDSLEGTLTEEQKEALSKENPDWEFDKSYENIPNSLEGKLTQEQMETLSEENYDVEYEWEDTASNPVPGTPSYVAPKEEEKRYVNPDGGAPLYEDELTEDEKDYYEEYKPEKE